MTRRLRMPSDPMIPKTITLPSGETYQVSELFKRRTRATNHNLRQLKVKTKNIVPKGLREPTLKSHIKYTVEDRIWQAQATVEEIQSRYNLSPTQAQSMKYSSRYIIEQLDLLPK